MGAHKIAIDPKYEQSLNNFKTKISNLEKLLNDPEKYIDEEIHALKRQVDLDLEKTNSEIDRLANEFIQQLKTFEEQFKAEYKTKVDMTSFISLVETSKNHFAEYEKCVHLLSSNSEEKEKKRQQSEILINDLIYKLRELKGKLFGNQSITYKPTKKQFQDIYDKLVEMLKL